MIKIGYTKIWLTLGKSITRHLVRSFFSKAHLQDELLPFGIDFYVRQRISFRIDSYVRQRVVNSEAKKTKDKAEVKVKAMKNQRRTKR